MAVLRRWQAACYAAGYVGRAWPAEFGGGGRPPVEQIVVDQELAAAGAPEFVNIVGLGVLGPSLLRFGNDEQRRRYIPPILSAEEIWCQGFSEPEAGSDLASLRTRAVQDGDTFVINGQKTWVSWGQYAKFCGLLARTDDSVARHRGISMLIVDMSSPGVEVRPMTQITGHAEFSELFLDDVVVPRENLLGELGDGWKIAMYTLGHERGTAALPRQVKLRTWFDRAVSVAGRRELDGRPVLDDPEVQTALARALIGIEVLRHHAYRTAGEFLKGGAVGPESSSVKLLMTEAEQRLASHRARGARADVAGRRSRRRSGERLLVRDVPVFPSGQRVRRHSTDTAGHHRRPNPVAPQGIDVDLELSDEQVWLEESINTLLDRRWPPAEAAWQAGEAERARLWESLVEFGLLGGAGTDLGAIELCLVARAVGGHLAAVPLLGSVAVRYALAPFAGRAPGRFQRPARARLQARDRAARTRWRLVVLRRACDRAGEPADRRQGRRRACGGGRVPHGHRARRRRTRAGARAERIARARAHASTGPRRRRAAQPGGVRRCRGRGGRRTSACRDDHRPAHQRSRGSSRPPRPSARARRCSSRHGSTPPNAGSSDEQSEATRPCVTSWPIST